MPTKTKNALNMKAAPVGSCIWNEIRQAIWEKILNKLDQKLVKYWSTGTPATIV